MTVKEFYDEVGGDYNEVMERLRKEDRIGKYLKFFIADASYANMCKAIDDGDSKGAFEHSHNLKGVSANLGLTSLSNAASDICEQYRHGEPDENLTAIYDNAKKVYDKTMKAIDELLAE